MEAFDMIPGLCISVLRDIFPKCHQEGFAIVQHIDLLPGSFHQFHGKGKDIGTYPHHQQTDQQQHKDRKAKFSLNVEDFFHDFSFLILF